MKIFLFVLLFCCFSIKEARSTEPVDCGNDRYLVRVPVSLTTDEIAGVYFYGSESKATPEEFVIVEKLDVSYLSWPKRILKLEKKSGAPRFRLDAKGSRGWLSVGGKKYKVECSWMQ